MLSVKYLLSFLIFISFSWHYPLFAQKKIRPPYTKTEKKNQTSPYYNYTQDTSLSLNKKKSNYPSAKMAAIWSGLLPGAGQIYNKSYWKTPIVWGIIGFLGYLVVDNYIWYQKTGFAYKAKQLEANGDPSLVSKIDPVLLPLSTASVRNYRNQFRNDIDLSGLFLLLGWGLNIVEAAVDAHLKTFDVTPSLTFNVRPSAMQTYGIALSFHIPYYQKHGKTLRQSITF